MKQLSLTVNGRKYEVLVEESDMLSTVIREKIGLTGTKVGCSQGSCGACTIIADENPILSCITPAIRFEGKEITTIEGVSENGTPSLLQELFVQKGAIQCGFCTPGMVLTTQDFIYHHPEASREDIKEALSGNLCRCTGYKKIIDAVFRICTVK
jgi:aerobic carbon-monoxide dehydrogenase small subunit